MKNKKILLELYEYEKYEENKTIVNKSLWYNILIGKQHFITTTKWKQRNIPTRINIFNIAHIVKVDSIKDNKSVIDWENTYIDYETRPTLYCIQMNDRSKVYVSEKVGEKVLKLLVLKRLI